MTTLTTRDTPRPVPAHRPRTHPHFLPPASTGPTTLAAVGILPQLILLGLNLLTWRFLADEVTADQRSIAIALLSGELTLLFATASYTIRLARRRELISRRAGLPLMLLPAGYLAATLSFASDLIPASVATWIVPPDQWIFKQFAFIAPLVLFGALRFISPTRGDNLQSHVFGLGGIAILTAVTIGIALFGSVLISVVAPIFNAVETIIAPHLFGPAMLTVGIALGMLTVASIMRIVLSLYVAARRRSPLALAILTAILAVGGPLAGLTLNATIPFPTDLQSPALYALALLNGLVLTLPNFARPALHRAVWLAQCALFPFTVYFFILFVPYLPLTPLAALFVGLGLLMVVPPVLFILHGVRLIDGYRAEIRDGHRFIPFALALTAILAWPVHYTVSARVDRAALHQALDYLTYPDHATPTPFSGDLPALKRSLHNLRSFKTGRYLPLISEYYNWLTFDNLVLPDSQLDAMETAFFGETSAPLAPAASFFPIGNTRNLRRTAAAINPAEGLRPTANAVTRSVTTTPTPRGLRTTIQIHNPTPDPTEYHTTLRIPADSLVTGFTLTIGNEVVPGRLFEQRAAEWVYRKITEIRPVLRDPAILKYAAPGTLDLRVFPVAPGETRTTTIETNSTQPVLVDAPPPTHHASPLTDATPHFIIDLSADSAFAKPTTLLAALRTAAAQLGLPGEAHLTFANYEITDFRGGKPVDLNTLTPTELATALPSARGGFLENRALRTLLRRAQDTPARLIVLRDEKTPAPQPDPDLPWFAALTPQTPGYTVVTPAKNAPRFIPFPKTLTRIDYPAAPSTRSPLPVKPETPEATMRLALQRIYDPTPENSNHQAELLALARRTHTLVPSIATIVVEDSAQWKMLEATEERVKGGHEALTLTEDPAVTPEPGTLLLLAVAAAALYLWHQRTTRPSRSFPKSHA